MEFLAAPPSQGHIITRKSHFTALRICIPRFAAVPFAVILLFTLTSPAAEGVSYSDHCGEIVRGSTVLENSNYPILKPKFLALYYAHADYRVNDDGQKDVSEVPMSLSLSSRKAFRTQKDGLYKVEATLSIYHMRYFRNSTRRGLRLVHFRPPRIPLRSGETTGLLSFSLSGFWDSVSGKLCMVGAGFGKLSSNHVVLKLDYLNSSNIFTSLVNGTLESLDVNSESGFYLKSISILGVNLRNYRYELIDKESEISGFSSLDDMSNVSLAMQDSGQKVCQNIVSAGIVELEYKNDCNSVNCNFLGRGNGNFTPSEMYFNKIECLEDGRVRFLLGFENFRRNGYGLSFEPNLTLVSEGRWDAKKRRLNMVACRIFSDWDEGFVGECLIRLSLRFPAKWTLRNRSSVFGELWSSRSANEPGYFSAVTFSSKRNRNIRGAALSYEYTNIENTRGFCANKTMRRGGGKYPNALSSDMRFDMIARNKQVTDLWGYSSPIFVDSWPYRRSFLFIDEAQSAWQGKQNVSGVINVSYILSLASSHDFKLSSGYMQIKSIEISAEGTYDSESGHLCMTGCMHVEPSKSTAGRNSSLDCEILIDIQYPPANARNGDAVKGTIESRREKSDRLYFERFEILSRSIYSGQAKESIWRMDLEITMVLISNTLLCVFLVLQLFHVKRHADVLPSMSVTMLIVLTLGHLIPLLLNFEAIFLRRNTGNVYLDSDGWLEVNEVLVRVITMVAFLLEFRLLQLTWSAKSGEGSQNNQWICDKKVLYLSLPIYIGGGLIAWFLRPSRKYNQRPLSRIHPLRYKQQSFWGDLKSYAGLILDGFLFPQILFNVFLGSKENALAPSFYVGTTFVRLMPHAYDLYRSHSSTWSFSYIYANPGLDYYSTTWDVVISVGGLLFAVTIYLQQRYGGRCLLPKRFSQRSTYEKVPVVTDGEKI